MRKRASNPPSTKPDSTPAHIPVLQRIRQWLGPRLPGPWRWHTLAEAEAYLLALEDDDD